MVRPNRQPSSMLKTKTIIKKKTGKERKVKNSKQETMIFEHSADKSLKARYYEVEIYEMAEHL